MEQTSQDRWCRDGAMSWSHVSWSVALAEQKQATIQMCISFPALSDGE